MFKSIGGVLGQMGMGARNFFGSIAQYGTRNTSSPYQDPNAGIYTPQQQQTAPLQQGSLKMTNTINPALAPQTAQVSPATQQQTTGYSAPQNNIYTTPSGAQVNGTTGQMVGGQNQMTQTGSQNPFSQYASLFNNPQSNQYLNQQVDTLSRLQALQQQLAEAQVPGAAEMGLQNQINDLTNTIQNTNPNQLLKDNPSFKDGGITEGQLERVTAQQQLPMTQSLSNLVLSKSVLGQQRQITANQLGAEATGLTNTASLQDKIRQLTQFGGLPPEIVNTILQRQLFPQYGVTTDITGQPIAYNQYDPSQNFTLGSGGYGAGGQAGGMPPTIQAAINSVRGMQYIDLSKLTDKEKGLAQMISSQYGIPLASQNDVEAIQSAQTTFASADSLLNTIEGLSKSVITAQSPADIPGQYLSKTLGALFRTDADARVFKDTISSFSSLLTRAAGEKGTLTDQDVQRIINALPKLTDTWQIAQQKLQSLRTIYDAATQGAIQSRIGGSGNSNGNFSGGDTFGNAAAWQ